jgi:CubicO group peptidase (beta-lactamase class C family)
MNALDLVGTWPVATAAVGVLGAGIDGTAGDTADDTADGGMGIATIGATDRPFPWASLTKPVTALAVLVAVEEGTLSLDTSAGPVGSTIRHLLAHASGLAPDEDRPMAAPGTRRIYSNAGYQVLSEVLAEASGMPFVDYVHEGVLRPLGMTGSAIDPESERRVTSGAASTVMSGAAAGLVGPLRDLLALAGELMAPTLVGPETIALATSVAFPGLAGVLPGFGRFDPCDWGLGVEIRSQKHPHWTGTANSPATFGHFGRSGSFLWVDPVAQVACAGLGDRSFGPWAAEAWPRLADAVLAEVRTATTA